MASSADRRRVKGPEGSQPPVFASPAAVDERRRILRQKQSGAATDTDTDDAEATHVDEHAHRIERGVAPVCTGRGAHDLRPIYPELNVEVRLAPYALPRRARPGKDVESASLSALVTQALLPSIRLDLLPKATLDIFITVLEADALDEGCAAASATLASTALADAGVDLYGLVVGSTAAYYPRSRCGYGSRSTVFQSQEAAYDLPRPNPSRGKRSPSQRHPMYHARPRNRDGALPRRRHAHLGTDRARARSSARSFLTDSLCGRTGDLGSVPGTSEHSRWGRGGRGPGRRAALSTAMNNNISFATSRKGKQDEALE